MLHAPEFAPFPPRETARSQHPVGCDRALGPIGEAALEADDVDESSLGVDGPSATGHTVDGGRPLTRIGHAPKPASARPSTRETMSRGRERESTMVFSMSMRATGHTCRPLTMTGSGSHGYSGTSPPRAAPRATRPGRRVRASRARAFGSTRSRSGEPGPIGRGAPTAVGRALGFGGGQQDARVTTGHPRRNDIKHFTPRSNASQFPER